MARAWRLEDASSDITQTVTEVLLVRIQRQEALSRISRNLSYAGNCG